MNLANKQQFPSKQNETKALKNYVKKPIKVYEAEPYEAYGGAKTSRNPSNSSYNHKRTKTESHLTGLTTRKESNWESTVFAAPLNEPKKKKMNFRESSKESFGFT